MFHEFAYNQVKPNNYHYQDVVVHLKTFCYAIKNIISSHLEETNMWRATACNS